MAADTKAQTERTPQDYAIEHAEYMAKGAEHLIAAVNDLALAEQECDEGTANESDVDAARETLAERLKALRSYIYEFRKRRDRASAPVAQHHNDQALHADPRLERAQRSMDVRMRSGAEPVAPTAPPDESNLGDAIRALIRGDIKCSDDLPLDKRPVSVSARRAFGAVYALLAQAQPSGDEALKLAYDEGWCTCAGWAHRPDLITDCDSAAYEADRAKALSKLTTRLEGTKGAQPKAKEHVCGAQGFNPMLGDECPACEERRGTK